MSSPVRAVSSAAPICDAHKQLLRYGHTGLCVVDASGALVGVISRRDVDVAMRHGLEDSAVITAMSAPVKTIEPTTPLLEIRSLMVTYDLGRLPVVAGEELVGIVTRSDLLRQLCVLEGVLGDLSQLLPRSHISGYIAEQAALPVPPIDELHAQLKTRIAVIWPALMLIAETVREKGWTVYLVGGAVRDLLLNCLGQSYPLTDIDLVVDGAESGAGATLAEIIEASYPQVTAQVYGAFQTATLTWPAAENGHLSEFSIDIATARTEFYAYPAANPEVEVSTIHQDLYRRDFTVNAIAYSPHREALVDPVEGYEDILRRRLRMISRENLVDDPLRLLRAYRQAAQLGFEIERETEQAIAQLGDRIAAIAAERIQSELNTLLFNPRGLPWLERAWQAGLLRTWLPDLDRSSLGQIACLDQLGDLAATAPPLAKLLTPPASYQKSSLGKDSCLPVAKLVVLCAEASELAEAQTQGLKYSRLEMRAAGSVRRLQHLLRSSEMSIRDQYFLFQSAGDLFPVLALVELAEQLKADDLSRLSQAIEAPLADVMRSLSHCLAGTILLPLLERYANPADPVAHPRALVSGKALMKALEIKSGPQIGLLLMELQIAQAEGLVGDEEGAIAWLKANQERLLA